MRRRELLALLIGNALAGPMSRGTPVAAQQRAAVAKVGFLHPRISAAIEALRLVAIREGLEINSQNDPALDLIPRVADGTPDRLAAFAIDLAVMSVDVIIAISPSAVAAARAATATIPIVAVDLVTDPVASGWAESLARPGGNVTGVFLDLAEISAKCLQFLAETVPDLAKVGVLWDPSTGPYHLAAVEAAAASLGTTLLVRKTDALAGIDEACRSVHREGGQAALLLSSPLFAGNSAQVAEFAARHGLPAITLFPEFARNGGFLAYGPDLQALFRQGAKMARRVLHGTKPAELPIERPTRFEMVINLKTARALGLDPPRSLLARADEVIE